LYLFESILLPLAHNRVAITSKRGDDYDVKALWLRCKRVAITS